MKIQPEDYAVTILLVMLFAIIIYFLIKGL